MGALGPLGALFCWLGFVFVVVAAVVSLVVGGVRVTVRVRGGPTLTLTSKTPRPLVGLANLVSPVRVSKAPPTNDEHGLRSYVKSLLEKSRAGAGAQSQSQAEHPRQPPTG